MGCATANWENHDLLKYYISVLLNVSMSKNTHIALTTEGGMDLVVRAMRQFPAAQDVQFRCCRILGNLISNKVALLQDDWHLLLDAMRTHRADPDIQIVCGWILDELSIDEAKLPALHELGTVNCILSALSTHKDNVPVHQHCLEVSHGLRVLCKAVLRATTSNSCHLTAKCGHLSRRPVVKKRTDGFSPLNVFNDIGRRCFCRWL